MEFNLTGIQTQKQVFSQSLEKSIAILALPHPELQKTIEQELQDNPLLEAEPEKITAVLNLPSIPMRTPHSDEDQGMELPSLATKLTLEDYLLQQLHCEISNPQKRKIGEFIIGNLDQDGFLHLTEEEIAHELGLKDTFMIKEALTIIRNFDPAGIATANLKECLLAQLQNRQSPYRELAKHIVEHHFNELGKRHATLAKKIGKSPEDITQAALLIASLEPRPARNYTPIDHPNIYFEPDLYLRRNNDGEYILETNKVGLPALRISATYRNLLTQANLSKVDREFIKERVNNALTFIKNIAQRGETLTAIGQYIIKHQRNFFDNDHSTLIPMKLKDVAAHLERAESTISRAISHKYMDTPHGLYPLRYFFSHSAAKQEDQNVSGHHVEQELLALIEEENKKSPLSDQDIQGHFEAKGVHLARRTITKYRQKLNIPSSHLRK